MPLLNSSGLEGLLQDFWQHLSIPGDSAPSLGDTGRLSMGLPRWLSG